MKSPVKMAIFVGLWALANRLPHPRARAAALRGLGAKLGENVRIHPCRLINFEQGFSNLQIGSNVYIGADVLLDLAGPLQIGDRATISARCCIMTHHDSGASHNNALLSAFPPTKNGCQIGADAWLGVGVIVLEGCTIGSGCAVGAGAVVTRPLPSNTVCVGVPAAVVRQLANETLDQN